MTYHHPITLMETPESLVAVRRCFGSRRRLRYHSHRYASSWNGRALVVFGSIGPGYAVIQRQ